MQGFLTALSIGVVLLLLTVGIFSTFLDDACAANSCTFSSGISNRTDVLTSKQQTMNAQVYATKEKVSVNSSINEQVTDTAQLQSIGNADLNNEKSVTSLQTAMEQLQGILSFDPLILQAFGMIMAILATAAAAYIFLGRNL